MNPDSLLSLTAAVLRDPDRLVVETDSPTALSRRAPALLGIGAAGAALFGVAVGSYHDGLQALYAGLKMPALFLIPPLLTLPALHAACRVTEAPVRYRRLAIASLVGVARSGVLAAAVAPALWLPYSVNIDYHLAILLFAGALALIGLPGLTTIVRAVPRGGVGRSIAMAGALMLVGVVLAQTGWLLRPFVARPTAAVAFLRPVEANVVDALLETTGSAAGFYTGWEAERGGLVNRSLEAQ